MFFPQAFSMSYRTTYEKTEKGEGESLVVASWLFSSSIHSLYTVSCKQGMSQLLAQVLFSTLLLSLTVARGNGGMMS